MAKKNSTEILNPVLGSKFLEYSHSDDHFAISLQKRSVFDEKLYFESLANFKKVFFSKNERIKIFFFRTRNPDFF